MADFGHAPRVGVAGGTLTSFTDGSKTVILTSKGYMPERNAKMDKNQKALRSLIEHNLIYSRDYRERKSLIDIYHQADGTEDVKTKSEPKSKEGWGLYFIALAGITFASTLLANLIAR